MAGGAGQRGSGQMRGKAEAGNKGERHERLAMKMVVGVAQQGDAAERAKPSSGGCW